MMTQVQIERGEPKRFFDDYTSKIMKTAADAGEFENFCFYWFNAVYPDEMAVCLKTYDLHRVHMMEPTP